MSTDRRVGDVAVEVTPEPEGIEIEVLQMDDHLVKVRIWSQSLNATVFLEPGEAEELGQELIEEAAEIQ